MAALTAAELVDDLSGDGPFTVFAPTDDAFAALPEGALDGLLADIPALTDVLLYHVVAGKLLAADVIAETTLTTLQGDELTVRIEGDSVYINDALVILTDIEASNGVIHVIDAVLLPPAEPAPQTIVDIAVSDDRFETLVAALTAAELVDDLSGDGPFTVFAPTDDAFAALPEGALDGLLADIPALTDVLLYHVVAGKLLAADVIAETTLTTLQGDELTVRIEGDSVYINDALVILTDIEASNGVIHVIDAVLLPPA